jgi:hypothetical protein
LNTYCVELLLPAAVAKDQQAFRLRPGGAAVFFPPQGDAVAARFADVVGGVEVNRGVVVGSVVDAVRDQLAVCRAGKIVVERLDGLFRVSLTRTMKIAQLLSL